MNSEDLSIIVKDNSLAIVGWDEGGAGQIDSWLEDHTPWKISCFVHPDDTPPQIDAERVRATRPVRNFSCPTDTSFKDRPLICAMNWEYELRRLGIRRALVLTGEARLRAEHLDRAREAGIELISAIHPSAMVMPDAVLAENVVLHARAFVGYRSEVQRGVVLNTGAQLDHHSLIEECATLDPGVITAGYVHIGRFARVHTGATVINKIRIGSAAVVGAGAVVIRDVPPHTTVVGVPAKPITRS